MERLYPLSPFQTAIYRDIVDSLAQRKSFLDQPAGRMPSFSAQSSSRSASSSSSTDCAWAK